MTIFLKDGYQHTGMHRFLESFSFIDKVRIIFVPNINTTNFYNDEIAIFGGFLPEDLYQSKIAKKYYVFCSPLGQADLSSPHFYSVEMQIIFQLQHMINNKEIINVITSSKNLSIIFNFIYIPPIRNLINKDVIFNKERKNYGFLGNNFRKHKNVVNQIAAISMLKPKENIVVRHKEHYKDWGILFNCNFVDKDLKNDEEYFKEISTHRMSFQCSFSESFNYQAFEYACMGVPTICSHCVSWMPKQFVVDNNDNPLDIALLAQHFLSDDNRYLEESRKLQIYALELNKIHKQQVEEIYYSKIEGLV